MTKRPSPNSDFWAWEETDPIPVPDGLKARSQSGAFTQHWWAGRWVQAIAQWVNPARLARGRSYVRRGQVVDLDIQVGLVLAHVQGTRATPYRVRIEVKTLSEAEWGRVIEALASRALYAAQLLNGEMPQDVEGAFQSAGVSLFPELRHDLLLQCTCPDPVKPCKHIAAVCYLLGERFDEDPFGLFVLRGRTREQIMAALRERHADRAAGPSPADAAGAELQPQDESSPFEARPEAFWQMGPGVEEVRLHVAPPEIEMEVIKMLGDPTFAEDPALLERLADIYRVVSRHALEVAFEEHERDGQEPPSAANGAGETNGAAS